MKILWPFAVPIILAVIVIITAVSLSQGNASIEEPTRLTCMDMRVSIDTVNTEEMRARMSGEAVLCAEAWWISSTHGPTMDAWVESGGEIVVRPWAGPRLGETQ